MRLNRRLAQVRKLLALLRVPSYRRALLQGVAASVEHARTPLPAELRTVIDVGSNRGQFALLSRHRWPRAQILCFEPIPVARDRLQSLFAADPAVEVFPVALSNRAGERDMHMSRADDSSSLLALTALQTEEFPGTEEVGTRTVQTQRLDEVVAAGSIARPSMLKIDVQGGELEVLQGAGAVLDEVDVVLVECSWVEFYAGQALADEILAHLGGRGLHMRALVSPVVAADGTVMQADIVLTRT